MAAGPLTDCFWCGEVADPAVVDRCPSCAWPVRTATPRVPWSPEDLEDGVR